MILKILKDKIRTYIYNSRTNISNNLDKNIEKKLLSKKLT